MFFSKKKPQRLYLPAKSRWYTRPRPRKREKFWVRGKKKVVLQRRISLFKRQWFYWIVGAGILTGVLLILFFSTYLKIAKINVVRHDLHVDSAAIQELLKPYIGENILFFNRGIAEAKVKEHFVEYAKVWVKKDLPNMLRVELESQPLVFNVRAYYTLLQPEDQPLEIEEGTEAEAPPTEPEQSTPAEPEETEQKALLNGAGQVILNQEENLELRTLTLRDLTRPMEDRETLISPERLKALRAAMERFEELFPDQRIETLEYFPAGREVHLQLESGLTLWVTFEKDPVAQIEKLYSIYEPAALDQEDLAYIDLRVIEKVIYCPRGANCDLSS